MSRTAVLTAVASLLACSGFALADSPKLSLDPTVITADGAASQGLLMQCLDKAGLGKPLADAKLTIDGWIESGYTYDHRHADVNTSPSSLFGGSTFIIPGPFNNEYHNHYMLNQVVLRAARQVDTKTFDVGGLIEVMYGSDASKIHSGGLGYNGSDPTDDNIPADPAAVHNLDPAWQFDIPQAYVTVNLPVGNGLQILIGKYATLLGYETFDATANPFYSHSYLFSAEPATQTGVVGSYSFNDQLAMKLGVTRGWDMATEDNNGSVDVTGQISYQCSKQLNFVFNYTVGPEDKNDSSHYRTAANPVIYWQATDALKFGLEGLYVYDGGWNAGVLSSNTHAYGDVWGAALYAGYKVNDMLTVNGRIEKAHAYLGEYAGYNVVDTYGLSGIPALSVYEITLGVTVTPCPKDQYLKGLSIRPEVRYDFTDSSAYRFFPAEGRLFKDQLTFACDVIFAF